MIRLLRKIGAHKAMLRIMMDCRCLTCDAVTEHWINEVELAVLLCPECGNPDMKKMIGAPKLAYTMMATDGTASSNAMTTSIDKWVKMRDQKARIEKRNMERHGTLD